MGDDQILLDVHELLHSSRPESTQSGVTKRRRQNDDISVIWTALVIG